MIPVDELRTRLDELRRVRAEGRRELRYADGRHVVYGTDAELADAIRDLERQITPTPVTTVLVAASKGLCE